MPVFGARPISNGLGTLPVGTHSLRYGGSDLNRDAYTHSHMTAEG